ncbi:MAG TPA: phenylalanine--tRNA ligase subunit beta [Nitrososphaerales archaeon]|nr:phenylalanine--tRNA ligase subunit beta [Nitrososphaerales archaeon]
MPVVRAELTRLSRMVGADRKRVLDRLPYIGLDIESVDGDVVRVEYSPNRPDFGTDFGIARALRGLFGKEVGLPTYRTAPSGLTVTVDGRLSQVRPFIACATVTGLALGDEDVRQIISLQEDLHNGLGRKRRVVAIGLHDLDAVKGPLRYSAQPPSFGFVPLDGERKATLAEILKKTEQGRLYGRALEGGELLPIILDSRDTVLSFPPIINGNATKVSSKTRNLFIDVTSTDRRAGDDVLAILATTLGEAGGRIDSVVIQYPDGARTTPDLAERKLRLDFELIERSLGLGLTKNQVADCLGRSRLAVIGSQVLAPRFRIDLLHPVDLAEEVALGYGFDRIGPLYPASKQPGSFNALEEFLDRTSTIMAGAGMTELMTFELMDKSSLYDRFGRPSDSKIAVHDPRSQDHSILRDSLLPPMMAALSGNVKEDYPQRVFEIGRVYARTKGEVRESWSLGCLIAHSQTSFTEAKMYLAAALRTLTGIDPLTAPQEHWAFAEGRSASVSGRGTRLGSVGELKPEALAAFGLNVPAAGFESDLSVLFKLLK